MAEKDSERFALRDKKYGITSARLRKGSHTESKKKAKSTKDEDEE